MSSLDTATQRPPRGLSGETLTLIATTAQLRLKAAKKSDFALLKRQENVDGANAILSCMISEGIRVCQARQRTWSKRNGYGDELAAAMFHKAHQMYYRKPQENVRT